MEIKMESHRTPQKSVLPEHFNNSCSQKFSSLQVTNRKLIHPRTPKSEQQSSHFSLLDNSLSNCSSSAHSIQISAVQTPPAKRYHKIKNPFEVTLAETLHHPLIARYG